MKMKRWAQGDNENERITGRKSVHIVISFIFLSTLSMHVHVPVDNRFIKPTFYQLQYSRKDASTSLYFLFSVFKPRITVQSMLCSLTDFD